ncbi:MAG: hypothetical protein MUO97_02380, partial [Dehalococcoidia bacterium]|nr:hypothetical protein [Dehalococcoidia bacterium]
MRLFLMLCSAPLSTWTTWLVAKILRYRLEDPCPLSSPNGKLSQRRAPFPADWLQRLVRWSFATSTVCSAVQLLHDHVPDYYIRILTPY